MQAARGGGRGRGGGGNRGRGGGDGNRGRGRGRGEGRGAGANRGGRGPSSGRGPQQPRAPSAPAQVRPAAPVAAVAPPPAPVAVAAPPPARAVEQLAEELEEKAQVAGPSESEPTLVQPLVRMNFPSRRGFGKVGKPVTLYANHFKVDLRLQDDVYHYDVAMSESGGKLFPNGGVPPRAVAEKIMRALLVAMKKEFPAEIVVSDLRKNLYAPRRLPFAEHAFDELDIDGSAGSARPRLFKAVVKAADPIAIRMSQLEEMLSGRLNYTPHDALQALDVALRHTAAQRFTVIGNSLYSGVGAKWLGEGAEAWQGYFQSLRPTQNRLIVNIDLSTTAFVRAMPVLDFLAEVVSPRDNVVPSSLATYQHSSFSKAVRGVRVEITHRPGVRRAYRVNGLSPQNAEQTFFEDENGKRTSVAQYFAKHYKPLRYPKLPCLHVGAVQKKTYMPIEVCHVVAGQKCPRKTTENQTAEMIKVACTKPQDRQARIQEKVNAAGFGNDQVLKAFGLGVDPNMVSVRGRVLPPPTMVYKNPQRKDAFENPRDGAWNMRNKAFYEAQQLKSFAVITLDQRTSTQDINRFFSQVLRQAGELGMGSLQKNPPIIAVRRGETVRNAFASAMQAAQTTYGAPAQIIWMINPRQDVHTYGELKRVANTEFGVVSQCMLSKHIARASPQYVANILLKVNTKLGGKNTIVRERLPRVQEVPTIIMGADVTHPGPGDRTKPSIAAVVGSVDFNFMRFTSVARSQGHRVEQIMNMKDMARELLLNFFRASRQKPQRIVFYRDGVSEGQFHMVLNHEVTAIRQACASLEADYKPAITFIIVQKRHHTRFFVSNPKDADRSGNVCAGTVVDTGVCHPVENDFFLMSHAGLQGTSRPTHYHVVLDEVGFAPDDLQLLSYHLCYTFARCCRSVSIVPSAYYGHLLAYQARFATPDADTSSTSYASESAETDLRMFPLKEGLAPMYFV